MKHSDGFSIKTMMSQNCNNEENILDQRENLSFEDDDQSFYTASSSLILTTPPRQIRTSLFDTIPDEINNCIDQDDRNMKMINRTPEGLKERKSVDYLMEKFRISSRPSLHQSRIDYLRKSTSINNNTIQSLAFSTNHSKKKHLKENELSMNSTSDCDNEDEDEETRASYHYSPSSSSTDGCDFQKGDTVNNCYNRSYVCYQNSSPQKKNEKKSGNKKNSSFRRKVELAINASKLPSRKPLLQRSLNESNQKDTMHMNNKIKVPTPTFRWKSYNKNKNKKEQQTKRSNLVQIKKSDEIHGNDYQQFERNHDQDHCNEDDDESEFIYQYPPLSYVPLIDSDDYDNDVHFKENSAQGIDIIKKMPSIENIESKYSRKPIIDPSSSYSSDDSEGSSHYHQYSPMKNNNIKINMHPIIDNRHDSNFQAFSLPTTIGSTNNFKLPSSSQIQQKRQHYLSQDIPPFDNCHHDYLDDEFASEEYLLRRDSVDKNDNEFDNNDEIFRHDQKRSNRKSIYDFTPLVDDNDNIPQPDCFNPNHNFPSLVHDNNNSNKLISHKYSQQLKQRRRYQYKSPSEIILTTAHEDDFSTKFNSENFNSYISDMSQSDDNNTNAGRSDHFARNATNYASRNCNLENDSLHSLDSQEISTLHQAHNNNVQFENDHDVDDHVSQSLSCSNTTGYWTRSYGEYEVPTITDKNMIGYEQQRHSNHGVNNVLGSSASNTARAAVINHCEYERKLNKLPHQHRLGDKEELIIGVVKRLQDDPSIILQIDGMNIFHERNDNFRLFSQFDVQETNPFISTPKDKDGIITGYSELIRGKLIQSYSAILQDILDERKVNNKTGLQSVGEDNQELSKAILFVSEIVKTATKERNNDLTAMNNKNDDSSPQVSVSLQSIVSSSSMFTKSTISLRKQQQNGYQGNSEEFVSSTGFRRQNHFNYHHDSNNMEDVKWEAKKWLKSALRIDCSGVDYEEEDNLSQFSEPSNSSTVFEKSEREIKGIRNNHDSSQLMASELNTTVSSRSSNRSYWKRNDMVLKRTVQLIGTLLQKISIANDRILLLFEDNRFDIDKILSSGHDLKFTVDEIKLSFLELMKISKSSICALHNAFQPQKKVLAHKKNSPSHMFSQPILQQRDNLFIGKQYEKQATKQEYNHLMMSNFSQSDTNRNDNIKDVSEEFTFKMLPLSRNGEIAQEEMPSSATLDSVILNNSKIQQEETISVVIESHSVAISETSHRVIMSHDNVNKKHITPPQMSAIDKPITSQDDLNGIPYVVTWTESNDADDLRLINTQAIDRGITN